MINSKCTIGVDLGGTKILAAVVDPAGRILGRAFVGRAANGDLVGQDLGVEGVAHSGALRQVKGDPEIV